ncbi:glycosyltransferase family 4 protein [Aeromonas dhakensis]|uniref:glycosyltransferase family 4 protein n=1 Tax=Aeromonas dhakensis TaxID=196024 RepID=UPI00326CC332
MKVCIVGCLPVKFGGRVNGGIASHISDLYDNLKNKGFDVCIFSNSIDCANNSDVICYESVTHLLINSIRGMFKFNFFKINEHGFKARLKILADAFTLSEINKKGYSKFHVHSLNNSAAKSCEIAGLKYVVTDHAFWHGGTSISYIKENIDKAEKIIAISDFSRRKIISIGIDSLRIVKINNPIDKILTSKKEKPERIFRVYFNGISDGWERKGLSKISSELNDILGIENIELVIVSDNESIIKLKRENADIINSESLKIFGPLRRDENLSWLNSSDVFLSPSTSEGYSIAYLEAISLGVPVIGFEPNVKEINNILGREFCIGFDHYNDSIKESILEIKNRNEEKLVNVEQFYWEQNIDKFIALYRSI